MPVPSPLADASKTGVVLIDHGSRRAASNQLLEQAVAAFRAARAWDIVEPAHMELAEPTLADAFARCVAQGAERIVVFPYFLSPGRHWHEDIPRLAREAAAAHPGVSYLVTAPFGLHPLLMEVIDQRIAHCLAVAAGDALPCDVCTDVAQCRERPESASVKLG